MTKSQYLKAVAVLDLTAYSAGPILGVGWRQSLRYASGESNVPEPVARLLHMLQRYGIPNEWR